MKEWFHCAHMEKIMEEIIFEDVDCFFSSASLKKECRFRIKRGSTLEDILENIENIRSERARFTRSRDAQLYFNNRPVIHSRRVYERKNNFRQAQAPSHPPRNKNFSDSEDEDRVENTAYHLRSVMGSDKHHYNHRRDRDSKNKEAESNVPFTIDNRSRIRTYLYVAGIYNLKDDSIVDEVLKLQFPMLPVDSGRITRDEDTKKINEDATAAQDNSHPATQRPIPPPRKSLQASKPQHEIPKVTAITTTGSRPSPNLAFSDSEDDERLENDQYVF